MTYYIGTLSQCNYYNKKVIDGEADRGAPFYNGDVWAKAIKSIENSDNYAIIKHDNYEHSNMTLTETLPSEFINTEL